jgi:hypothetical protein
MHLDRQIEAQRRPESAWFISTTLAPTPAPADIGDAMAVVAQEKSPTFGYWHVWTDKNGISHQNRCELRDFELKRLSPPASHPHWDAERV